MNRRLVFLLVIAVACGGTSQPTSLVTIELSGTHALMAYDGQQLPARLFEIPATRAGDSTGCFVQMESGRLNLSVHDGAGSFSNNYVAKNSCTGATMSSYGWIGQVTVASDSLLFKSTGADGLVTSETAHLRAGSIVFDQRTPSLTFAADVMHQAAHQGRPFFELLMHVYQGRLAHARSDTRAHVHLDDTGGVWLD